VVALPPAVTPAEEHAEEMLITIMTATQRFRRRIALVLDSGTPTGITYLSAEPSGV
jgi:hypothetical protein